MKSDRILKVLLASHIGEPWGGVSVRYQDLLDSIYSSLVDVCFVETQDGIRKFDSTGKVNLRNILYSGRHLLRFCLTLIRVKPDVVHIATAASGSFIKHGVMVLFANLFQVKVILAPHCGYRRLIPKDHLLWKYYVKFILDRTDGVIILSREWFALTDELLIDENKLLYLPNSINLEPYLSIDRSSESTNDAFIFLYLGHVGEEKGIFDLIHATKRLITLTDRRFFINLIGGIGVQSSDLKIIKSMIDDYQLGEYLFLYDAEFGEEKLKRFQQADVYIFPSHHEGMPISIIEAMATGLPIIATDVGGIPDLVVNGLSGYLVPVKSPDLLADVMLKLMEDEKQKIDMGEFARKTVVDNHNVEIEAYSLVDFYNEIIQ